MPIAEAQPEIVPPTPPEVPVTPEGSPDSDATGVKTPEGFQWPEDKQEEGQPESPAAEGAEASPDAAPQEGADAEASPDATGEPEALAAHLVEIPLPNGDGENGPTNAGRLAVEFETQEAADTIRFHVKQSQRAQKLEARLNDVNADAQLAQYIRQHPEDGMQWMAEAQPEATQRFLASQIVQNPALAVQALRQLGFSVETDKDEDTILTKAKLAQYEAREAVKQGTTRFSQAQVQNTFQANAIDVANTLADGLGIGKDSARYTLFATAAAEELAKIYQATPTATTAQMTAALAPLAQEFSALVAKEQGLTAQKAKQAASQPRDVAGKFAEKAAHTDKFRKLAGGQTTVAPLSTIKIPPGTSWEQASDQLRAKGNRW